ncbi:hypothetical protein ACLKMH_15130 [Psychromonas sp. KJ10-10]|uniref:hypothetical protein n=1 Tax=Psychromonas sp. KJ10-10 TaxID=3391823 RepID=UPI0039B4FE64
MSVHIAEALTNASPEKANELVDWLTQEYPEQYTHIVVAMANAMPDDGIDLMELATENMSQEHASEVLEMTEEYVNQLSESLEAMRPVDRVAYASENTATELYNRLSEVSPEQSADIALTVSNALPESSHDVAEAYANNLIDTENSQVDNADASENIENAMNDYINQVVENIPETRLSRLPVPLLIPYLRLHQICLKYCKNQTLLRKVSLLVALMINQ